MYKKEEVMGVGEWVCVEKVSTMFDIRCGPGGPELSALRPREEGRLPGRLSISAHWHGSGLADMWSYAVR